MKNFFICHIEQLLHSQVQNSHLFQIRETNANNNLFNVFTYKAGAENQDVFLANNNHLLHTVCHFFCLNFSALFSLNLMPYNFLRIPIWSINQYFYCHLFPKYFIFTIIPQISPVVGNNCLYCALFVIFNNTDRIYKFRRDAITKNWLEVWRLKILAWTMTFREVLAPICNRRKGCVRATSLINKVSFITFGNQFFQDYLCWYIKLIVL